MPREMVVPPLARVFDAEGQEIDAGLPSYVKPVPEDGTQTVNPGLQVSWGGKEEGRLQVSVHLDIERLKGLVKAVEDGDIGTVDGIYGVYIGLNRFQTNNVIRVLRRARNAAFGVDE